MADLIRTKCGRIKNQEKSMLIHDVISSYFRDCYKKLFSPFAPKTCDLVQKTMGCHSEMDSFFKFGNLRCKTKVER